MSYRIIAAMMFLVATAWARPELAIARDGTLAEIASALANRAGLIDVVDEYGQGLLEYASVGNADPAVIRYLVGLGLDVNRQTPAGWTALMYAVHYNPEPEVTAVLIEIGADPGIVNHDGRRAVDLAQNNPNPAFRSHTVMALLLADPPERGMAAPPLPAPPTAPRAPSTCVDINSASSADLQRIIHIGPERAQELVRLRPFTTVATLTRINGIGAARLRDIQSQGLACVIR
jgi:hypothetical protein